MKYIQLLISAMLWITVQPASLRKLSASETLKQKTDRPKRTTSPTHFNGLAGFVLTQGLYQSHQEAANERAESERVVRNTDSSQSLPNKMSLGRMFPPEIRVTVQSGSKSETMSVALAPDMSTYDAIQAAESWYSYRNRQARVNPFRPSPRIYRQGDFVCAILFKMGGVEAIWNIVIKDINNEEVHNGRCIPARSAMLMRIGYTIHISSQQTN